MAVEIHTYGMFSWVLFAVVKFQTRLVYELALGLRFMETFASGVPVRRRSAGTVEEGLLEGSEFGTIRRRLGRKGSHPYEKGWRVIGHGDFNAGLPSLYRWAHRSGLLGSWLERLWQRYEDDLRVGIFNYGISHGPPMPPRPQDFADWTPRRGSGGSKRRSGAAGKRIFCAGRPMRATTRRIQRSRLCMSRCGLQWRSSTLPCSSTICGV